jgi:hypothetical protein
VSKFAVLYALAKQARNLGAFKLARHVLDRINNLKVSYYHCDLDIPGFRIRIRIIFENWIHIRIHMRIKSWIRIRFKSEFRSFRGSKWSRGGPWTLTMEKWRLKIEP